VTSSSSITINLNRNLSFFLPFRVNFSSGHHICILGDTAAPAVVLASQSLRLLAVPASVQPVGSVVVLGDIMLGTATVSEAATASADTGQVDALSAFVRHFLAMGFQHISVCEGKTVYLLFHFAHIYQEDLKCVTSLL
jgi:hypothetical protein